MESDLTMGFGIILQAKYICLPILRFQLVAGLFREICCSLSFSCFFGDSCVLFLQLNLSTFFFVVDLRRFAFLGLFFSTGASRHRQDCNYCGFFVFSFSVCFPRLFKLLSTTCDERVERIKKKLCCFFFIRCFLSVPLVSATYTHLRGVEAICLRFSSLRALFVGS